MKDKRVKLSKTISFLLRHRPDMAGLKPDSAGRVSLDDLLKALKQRKGFEWVGMNDIKQVMQDSEKVRFDIEDGKIRATYGHSIPIEHDYSRFVPTGPLYHGTARRSLGMIFQDGLLPRDRQFVHLSTDVETAISVGKRKDPNPVVLEIDAVGAAGESVVFYSAGPGIVLAERIPREFISVMNS